MDAIYHARSAARKWGGAPEDYLSIEEWIDQSGFHANDLRHRMLRHHSFGIEDAIARFGRLLRISTGKYVPVKQICERHIIEDLGFIPSVADWIRTMPLQAWMRNGHRRRVVISPSTESEKDHER